VTVRPAGRGPVLVLHAGFVLAGMATTLLGPVLPVLAARWRLTDAAAGVLFTTQFLSATTLTVLSSWIANRLGPGRALATGYVLVAIGTALLGVATHGLGLVATILYGGGLGLVLPLTNFVIAALRPQRAASALSLVNVSWGVGAVLWPLIVRTLAEGESVRVATSALAAGAGVMAAVLWAVAAARAGLRRERVAPVITTAAAGAASTPYRHAVLIGLVIFLYVGTETALGGWAAEFARRMAAATRDPGASVWSYAPMAFWAAQTLGRLLAPLGLLAWGERRMLNASLATAAGAVAWLVFAADTAVGVVVGAAAAGLGLAAIFPLVLAGATRDIAPRLPGAMGPLFAAGGVGGAVIPWAVGIVSTGRDSLQSGLVVALGAIGGMVVLTRVGRARAQSTSAA